MVQWGRSTTQVQQKQQELTPLEEETIVQFLNVSADCGFPQTHHQLQNFANAILQSWLGTHTSELVRENLHLHDYICNGILTPNMLWVVANSFHPLVTLWCHHQHSDHTFSQVVTFRLCYWPITDLSWNPSKWLWLMYRALASTSGSLLLLKTHLTSTYPVRPPILETIPTVLPQPDFCLIQLGASL